MWSGGVDIDSLTLQQTDALT